MVPAAVGARPLIEVNSKTNPELLPSKATVYPPRYDEPPQRQMQVLPVAVVLPATTWPQSNGRILPVSSLSQK